MTLSLAEVFAVVVAWVGGRLALVGTITVGELVAALPARLDSPVGERGRWLSGGQRQRVAPARALAADPELLVLHDPTTAVDAATEQRLADRLQTARSGRTTLLLTSRPALLSVCHRVGVVRDGRLVADAPQDVFRSDPDYAALVLA